MNLESVAKAVLEQFPGGDRPDLDRLERRVEKFGRIAFGGFLAFGLVAVLGICYAIIDKLILTGDRPWFGLLLLGFIIFASLMLAYVIFREDLKEKRVQTGPGDFPAEVETAAITDRLLEASRVEPVPTVTESTTELLPRDRTR